MHVRNGDGRPGALSDASKEAPTLSMHEKTSTYSTYSTGCQSGTAQPSPWTEKRRSNSMQICQSQKHGLDGHHERSECQFASEVDARRTGRHARRRLNVALTFESFETNFAKFSQYSH